jgi:hypothetical protein
MALEAESALKVLGTLVLLYVLKSPDMPKASAAASHGLRLLLGADEHRRPSR